MDLDFLNQFKKENKEKRRTQNNDIEKNIEKFSI